MNPLCINLNGTPVTYMFVTIQQIEDHLAGTQCEECGYKGCRPYAEAIFSGDAEINLCRPGGERVIKNLAVTLDKEVLPPAKEKEAPLIAWIDPKRCIGCTLCIQACPTDAIVGRSKRMHSVITDECTGCRLCIEPCPVDCIEMNDAAKAFPKAGDDTWEEARATQVAEWVRIKKGRKQRRTVKIDATEAAPVEQKVPELGDDVMAKIKAAREAARKKAEKKGPAPRPRKKP